jgi:beta-lactam-binding protein with PASTA domain
MKTKEFFGKFLSTYLWGNLLAMVLVVVALCFGVKYGLELYTRHGKEVTVPKLINMSSRDALVVLDQNKLEMMVIDSGFNKRLPAGCILTQSPAPGMKVKPGHIISVTVNSPSSPTFAIPDVIDNSSYREAEAKLRAMGFKLLPPKRIAGERDWVYGIMSRGRRVSTGDRISIETPLTLLIGNGQYGNDEEINYTAPVPYYTDEEMDSEDEFEEVEETEQTPVFEEEEVQEEEGEVVE